MTDLRNNYGVRTWRTKTTGTVDETRLLKPRFEKNGRINLRCWSLSGRSNARRKLARYCFVEFTFRKGQSRLMDRHTEAQLADIRVGY